MYVVIQDRGTDNEEIIWDGASRGVADQKFNTHMNSCEKGDFKILEIIRPMDDSDKMVMERAFRFK